jgi:hypothetical protein
MLMLKYAVSSEVELAFGVGLQARFEVVKSNEDNNTPPPAVYIRLAMPNIRTNRKLGAQSAIHESQSKHQQAE